MRVIGNTWYFPEVLNPIQVYMIDSFNADIAFSVNSCLVVFTSAVGFKNNFTAHKLTM